MSRSRPLRSERRDKAGQEHPVLKHMKRVHRRTQADLLFLYSVVPFIYEQLLAASRS